MYLLLGPHLVLVQGGRSHSSLRPSPRTGLSNRLGLGTSEVLSTLGVSGQRITHLRPLQSSLHPTPSTFQRCVATVAEWYRCQTMACLVTSSTSTTKDPVGHMHPVELKRPPVVVSDADCCAVGTGFESRRRHGCLHKYSAFAAWEYFKSRRATSPLVRLVEGEERWEAPDHPQDVLPLNWGGIEPNRTVTCMVLKTTANDKRHLAPFVMMNFVGLDLAFVDQAVTPKCLSGPPADRDGLNAQPGSKRLIFPKSVQWESLLYERNMPTKFFFSNL
ncbi:uncharacterized protein TNCV_789031 [Trichonephila clavipes]|nr:uncharacterized protein TNCV_789031 [Trichonephila clavipes]